MSSAGPSGFYNAPVTKGILLSVGINTILATMFDVRHKWHLQLYPHILPNQQLWRLITQHLFFSTTSQLIFGSLLIYHFRLIERQWSSSRYAAFAFIASAISSLLNVGALSITRSLGLKAFTRIPAGPWGFIFATLYQFLRGVPDSRQLKVFGSTVTDHIVFYMMSLQLLLTQAPESVLAGICGLFAGAIYDANLTDMKSWRFPKWLQQLAAKTLLPILGSSAPKDRLSGATLEDQRRERRERYAASMRGGPRMNVGQSRPAAAGRTEVPIPPPPEQAITLLQGMGFPRDRVLQALRRVNNDVERAAAILADG